MAIQNGLSILPRNKSNKEVIQDLVELVFELMNQEKGGNILMLKPAINIGKLKLAQMSEEDAAQLVDKIHFISHTIERETGVLSNYHGI